MICGPGKGVTHGGVALFSVCKLGSGLIVTSCEVSALLRDRFAREVIFASVSRDFDTTSLRSGRTSQRICATRRSVSPACPAAIRAKIASSSKVRRRRLALPNITMKTLSADNRSVAWHPAAASMSLRKAGQRARPATSMRQANTRTCSASGVGIDKSHPCVPNLLGRSSDQPATLQQSQPDMDRAAR